MNYKLEVVAESFVKNIQTDFRAKTMGYMKKNLCDVDAPKGDNEVPMCKGCPHSDACSVWIRALWQVAES